MSLVRTVSLCPRLVRMVKVQTMRCCLQMYRQLPPMLHPDLSSPQGSWLQTRSYAKKGKKDKGGGKGKGGSGRKISLTAEDMDGILDITAVDAEMQHALDDLKQQYIHQLSLRTSAGVFDNLMVSTTDGRFPLIQLGQIVQKSPQLLIINLAASSQHLPAAKKAIEQSGMNVNPTQDGTTLIVPLPKVTTEHRESLAKNAKTLCNKLKDRLRDIHAKHTKKVKANKEGHPEDLIRDVQDLVLETMRKYSGQAEDLLQAKQKDLLGK
ncbi:ribosome-recycling factor, mitochondrial-like [Haliotis rufescens]|uniref:ribosome-recycling factor, mitochondrial-like n=1 Tax=Haliotis rufescens TaxID=6454 RepID=UPI00201EA2D4|nr:ribosome-recycling factor, mitochondrial-like [Haliotis rufescens]XP_046360897.2 ribosome-recycling factor, mitochondrial-like [Haliotis rufescens]